MASETVVPVQSTDEHVEKNANDIIPNVEREDVSQSKRNGDSYEEEKVDAEGSASGEATVTESEKKTDDENIDVLAVVEVKKVEEIKKALGSDVSVDDGPKAAESSNQPLIISAVPEITVEVAEKESEEPPKISDVPESSSEAAVEKPVEHAEVSATPESAVKAGKHPEVSESTTEVVDKPKEDSETSAILGSAPEDEIKTVAECSNQSLIISAVPEIAVEVAEKELEEPPKISDVHESSSEAVVEKPMEHAEVSAAPESEVKVGKHPEVSESVTEVVDKPKEHSETSAVLGSAPEDEIKPMAESSYQPLIISAVPEIAVEVAEKDLQEPPKISDVPESSSEAVVEKPIEHAEVSATPESEVKAAKHPELSESVTEVVDKPKEHSETSDVLGSATEDEIKPEDQSVISDFPKSMPEMEEKREEQLSISAATELAGDVKGEVEKNIETLEAKVSVSEEVPKDGKSSTDKVDVETDSSKEELSVAEKVSFIDDSNKFENGIGNLDVDAGVEDMKEQESKTDAVELVLKEDVVEVGLPSSSPAKGLNKDIDTTSVTEIDENLMKVEDKVIENEEENVKTDESALTEATKTVDVSGLNSANEVAKDCFNGEKTSGDVEMVTEEKKKEIVKVDMPTSVETSGDRDVEVADANKQIENSQETELEGKPVEPIETTIDKLEKAEEKNEEALNSQALNLVDSSKDSGDKETTGEETKQEVPAKPAHRQSHGIISKVKQSIVKVKKAIIGKSPSSKTLSSEAKDEIKVK